jgi:low affinity Fe/Cu permease
MSNQISRLNNALASKMANVLSSMWLFWVLAVVLIVLWVIDPPKTAFDVALFVISTAFQAIALPVLAFVSNIQADRQEKILRETHKLVMEELKTMKENQAHFQEEQKELKELIALHKSVAHN